VIGADADPFFSAREYRKTASLLPDCSLRLFSGIGHEAVLERRRAFDTAVKTHLAGD
jgi:homoserine acetyltransferase